MSLQAAAVMESRIACFDTRRRSVTSWYSRDPLGALLTATVADKNGSVVKNTRAVALLTCL